jgi:hypothetical protein
MNKLLAGTVAIVVGLGLTLAVISCSSWSGTSSDQMNAGKMGSNMSGDKMISADKMSADAKMSRGKMGDKMSGENKMSGNSTTATDKMSERP